VLQVCPENRSQQGPSQEPSGREARKKRHEAGLTQTSRFLRIVLLILAARRLYSRTEPPPPNPRDPKPPPWTTTCAPFSRWFWRRFYVRALPSNGFLGHLQRSDGRLCASGRGAPWVDKAGSHGARPVAPIHHQTIASCNTRRCRWAQTQSCRSFSVVVERETISFPNK